MTVQTFVLGFALIVLGLIFRELVTRHYGWLAVAVLSTLFGACSLAYQIGHFAGVQASYAIARDAVSEIAGSSSPEARGAFNLVQNLPLEISSVGDASAWTFLVSLLLLVIGFAATLHLGHMHVLRIRRAAQIGVNPSDIKVNYTFGPKDGS